MNQFALLLYYFLYEHRFSRADLHGIGAGRQWPSKADLQDIALTVIYIRGLYIFSQHIRNNDSGLAAAGR